MRPQTLHFSKFAGRCYTGLGTTLGDLSQTSLLCSFWVLEMWLVPLRKGLKFTLINFSTSKCETLASTPSTTREVGGGEKGRGRGRGVKGVGELARPWLHVWSMFYCFSGDGSQGLNSCKTSGLPLIYISASHTCSLLLLDIITLDVGLVLVYSFTVLVGIVGTVVADTANISFSIDSAKKSYSDLGLL